MEMSDGNRRLIRDWETNDRMEGERCCCCRCCCGGEAGAQGPDPRVQLLRQRNTRLRRTAQLCALLLLLVSAALALLVAAVRGHQTPDRQPTGHSAGLSSEHQLTPDHWSPGAMLTAPRHYTPGKYLYWESKDGIAFCHGGFKYSNGSLVVPTEGVYRIFLQITYERKTDLMPKCHRNNSQLMLIHQVLYFRDSYRTDTPLLSSVDTVNCSMESWKKSMYGSGLFLLEANSKIRVKSWYPKLIAAKEHEVFFGAQLLQPSQT